MLNTKYKRMIKTIINNSYETSIYMIHTNNLSSLDNNFYDQFLVLHLPPMITMDKIIEITYNKIIDLIKQPLSTQVIEKMKEITSSYNRKRIPINLGLAASMEAFKRGFSQKNIWVKLFRNTAFNIANKVSPLKKKFMELATEL